MYSAMIFSVESERLRLRRSESSAIAKRKQKHRATIEPNVWFLCEDRLNEIQSREQRRVGLVTFIGVWSTVEWTLRWKNK